MDELMGINIKFGVSTIIHDVTELSRTFHEAAMALSRAGHRIPAMKLFYSMWKSQVIRRLPLEQNMGRKSQTPCLTGIRTRLKRRAVGADGSREITFIRLSATQSKNQSDQLIARRYSEGSEKFMSVIRPRTWKAGFISGSAKARHYIRCFRCAGK